MQGCFCLKNPLFSIEFSKEDRNFSRDLQFSLIFYIKKIRNKIKGILAQVIYEQIRQY